jgi:hypothetical protein
MRTDAAFWASLSSKSYSRGAFPVVLQSSFVDSGQNRIGRDISNEIRRLDAHPSRTAHGPGHCGVADVRDWANDGLAYISETQLKPPLRIRK